MVFQERRNHGRLDLEAVETAMRSAMHRAAASGLAQLLRYDPPDAGHRTIPCPCGGSADYKELRSKTILTVLGPVELRRPYYLCAFCSKGQYPADTELGIAGLESSPGVRRMEAVVGSEMPFAPGREPMKLLAGLDVTAKGIERAAEVIGAEIAQRDRQFGVGAVIAEAKRPADGGGFRALLGHGGAGGGLGPAEKRVGAGEPLGVERDFEAGLAQRRDLGLTDAPG